MRAGGSAKSPTATVNTQSIVVAIQGWRLAFVTDADPTTGCLRDLSETVSRVTDVDRDSALDAVVGGLAALPAPTLEDAA